MIPIFSLWFSLFHIGWRGRYRWILHQRLSTSQRHLKCWSHHQGMLKTSCLISTLKLQSCGDILTLTCSTLADTTSKATSLLLVSVSPSLIFTCFILHLLFVFSDGFYSYQMTYQDYMTSYTCVYTVHRFWFLNLILGRDFQISNKFSVDYYCNVFQVTRVAIAGCSYRFSNYNYPCY